MTSRKKLLKQKKWLEAVLYSLTETETDIFSLSETERETKMFSKTKTKYKHELQYIKRNSN